MPKSIKKETIDFEFQKANIEIGSVNPWWSEEDKMYIFEHHLYPFVIYGDKNIVDARSGYLKALRAFIEDRLNGLIANETDTATKGIAGKPGQKFLN